MYIKCLLCYCICRYIWGPYTHRNYARTLCMHVCVYVCMYVCMYACMYVCMYACMHACMHVCMYVLRANINRDRSSTALQGLGFRVGGLGMSYERTSTGIGVARPCSWAPTPPPDQPIFRSISKPLFEELSGVCWV